MRGFVRWGRTGAASRDASRGELLIEVLIALAILGMVSVVFIGALYTSLHAARIADERSVAFTLAKSQMEFVKTLPYSDNEWDYTVSTNPPTYGDKPTWWESNTPSPLDAEFAGYTVIVTGSDFDEDIRLITATAFHNDTEVFALQNYEVDRQSP